MPDEFAVESRAPLTVPPDFDLRPPEPGAPRPQEKTAKQRPSRRWSRPDPASRASRPPIFVCAAPAAYPISAHPTHKPPINAIVGSQSLSNKLLTSGATDTAGATVEKRETTPLKGIY